MEVAFYMAAALALIATAMAITRLDAVHALLYFAVSLVAVAVVFYTLGAPFVAALELIIYAGAIMVLFVFVVMLMNLGKRAIEMERALLGRGAFIGPAILAALLAAEIVYLATRMDPEVHPAAIVDSKQVALALYGPYVLGVELASMLLLAGLVAAYHLGWRPAKRRETGDVVNTDSRRADLGRAAVRDGHDGAPREAQPRVSVDVH
jgi:NADH-quinone oxidoreductase subunit J